jgi:protein-S-isoprenylcysteine O-methyltransferase Ste14
MNSGQKQDRSSKRTFWTVALFYGIIAFEFFYMASPFALYFYSAYRPGLNILLDVPGMAWLTSFFLPHIVIETSSPLINSHNIIGAILTFLGFFLFLITASQVYYAKLFKKGIVTGGIYHYIRHPQYVSFALCSFGLLLLWPRFLVLLMFVLLLFAYYFLAKAEEKECENKFGQSYLDYKNTTTMFLPFQTSIFKKWSKSLKERLGSIIFTSLLITSSLLSSFALAFGLKSLSLESLYTYTTKDVVYLSVHKLDENQIKKMSEVALADKEVQYRIFGLGNETRFLNYVVPADWYISEIPMHMTESDPQHFLRNTGYDKSIYKIIFCEPIFSCNCAISGKKIISSARTIKPVLEVWLDMSMEKVIDIKESLTDPRYENVPLPIF